MSETGNSSHSGQTISGFSTFQQLQLRRDERGHSETSVRITHAQHTDASREAKPCAHSLGVKASVTPGVISSGHSTAFSSGLGLFICTYMYVF